MDSWEAISPIDGRYRRHVEALAPIFSESGLIRARVMVEAEYFIALSEHPDVDLREFSKDEKQAVRELYLKFSPADAQIVKDIEVKGYKDILPTNQDVKAVEYFIKDKLANASLSAGASLAKEIEWIHFGLTSEDVNNLAYTLMVSDGLGQVVIPVLQELIDTISALAKQYKNTAILSRTHGQPASPSTFGKEFKVFASRLERQLDIIKNHKLQAKFNGATGNYNAHFVAYPKLDWLKFSQQFISSFNKDSDKDWDKDGQDRDKARVVELEPNLITTQIENHDSVVEVMAAVRHVNTILVGFSQDIWRYISDGWLVQKAVKGEIGSSTMPHKINPIDFENAEGNLGAANGLLDFFIAKLPISRLQRDLSDSTSERNFGSALAYSLIGYRAILAGLGKISVNEKRVKEELAAHPEVIAEAIQTILRREGAATPYEQLKELTRGKEVTMKDFHNFIDGLDVADPVKEELKRIAPENYTGIAEKLAEL